MSRAVQELYPQVGLGVGPAIENGFYQDYDLPEAITPEILPKLEKRIKELIKEKIEFKQRDVDFAEAYDFYKHDPYKTEFIDGLKTAGEKKVSFYKSGWFDNLCAGPHVATTREINSEAFKLTKIAGAYWRGDAKNKMLTRIYGVAFAAKQELDNYLKMIEEAEKRDHRKLGRELELFHIDETVGLGLPLWHPKGALLWRLIEDFWYQEHLKNDYQLVRSPHIGNQKLWETSGHWGFYNESMYPPLEVGQTLKENQDKDKVKDSEHFLLKPMNCPFHVQIFKSKPHSYRELPLRWAECGTVYRYEKKGELSGLTRVRGFTQDDAHIICTADQVEEELKKVVDFILFIYKSFVFEMQSVNVYLSVRDKESTKYAGTDQGWDFTEKVLEKIALEKGLNITKDVGGAVFYGPKLDFKVKDAIGREWQCSTLQFDFNLPERFDMTFINNKGEKERPYMLHRALFGSFERFIGVLIEHYAGAFPVWLAPEQVWVLPISDKHAEYANTVAAKLRGAQIRTIVKSESETIGKKIREGEKQKISYLLVVGDKEISSDSVAARQRGQGDLGTMKIEKFIEKITKEIQEKT